MRAYQIFAAMSPQRAAAMLGQLREQAPAVYSQALAVATTALKARPVYLARQPLERQADAARRALARVASDAAAEEVLATYFLECRREVLVEWLDAVGVAHEDGTLEQERPPAPPAAKLRAAVEKFRAGEDPEERELLLRTFAAQDAIRWPALDELIREAAPGPTRAG